ncbi:hypothetical protein BDY19DRAFT_235748 [Irpex rosettiformis]|uniref:Uncharacterized protein n=1 Tax=Irpex rosettiformis TaxID=378272 RepID=A0ACB8U062_9APHY|nr:hypothetical protein BDY19DRAFT_235748 [Irpex rosettiformis]
MHGQQARRNFRTKILLHVLKSRLHLVSHWYGTLTMIHDPPTEIHDDRLVQYAQYKRNPLVVSFHHRTISFFREKRRDDSSAAWWCVGWIDVLPKGLPLGTVCLRWYQPSGHNKTDDVVVVPQMAYCPPCFMPSSLGFELACRPWFAFFVYSSSCAPTDFEARYSLTSATMFDGRYPQSAACMSTRSR